MASVVEPRPADPACPRPASAAPAPGDPSRAPTEDPDASPASPPASGDASRAPAEDLGLQPSSPTPPASVERARAPTESRDAIPREATASGGFAAAPPGMDTARASSTPTEENARVTGDDAGRRPTVADHESRVARALPGDAGGGRSSPLPAVADPARDTPTVPGGMAKGEPWRVGRYEVRREVGRGGVGVVYEAWDPQLGRVVALKTLLAGRFASETQLVRFLREVHATAALRHPNIVPVHDAGTIEGRPYLTMDLIDGQPLDRLLQGEGRLAPRRVVELLVPIASALELAHGKGIVHRDVKPENILVDARGHPYLGDFGLAREIAEPQRLTRTDQAVGTPAFMAPEQLKGAPLDPRVDVYALGATLYECLTGRVPFTGDSFPELARQVMHDDVTPLRALDPRIAPDLEAIVLVCLEKDPARRYANAGELRLELERFLGGEAILARAPGRLRRLSRRLARGGPAVVGAAVALLGVVGGVGVALAVREELGAAEARLGKLEEERERLHESRRRADVRIARDEALRAAQAEAALAATLPSQVAACDRLLATYPDAWDVRVQRARLLRSLCHELRARDQDPAGAADAARRALADVRTAEEASTAETLSREGPEPQPDRAGADALAADALAADALAAARAAPLRLLAAELLRADLKDAAGAAAAYGALVTEPGSLGAYARARLAWARDDAPAALAEVDSSLALRPDLAPARALRCEVLVARGEPGLALVELDRLAGASASLAEVVRLRGEALLGIGDRTEALREALRATELDPGEVAAHLLLGRVRLEGDEPARAVLALDRARALAPRDPRPLQLLAEAFDRWGVPLRADACRRAADALLGRGPGPVDIGPVRDLQAPRGQRPGPDPIAPVVPDGEPEEPR